MLRPEALVLRALPNGRATVEDREFYGHDQLLKLRLDSGETLRARLVGGPGFGPGERVAVRRVGVGGRLRQSVDGRAGLPYGTARDQGHRLRAEAMILLVDPAHRRGHGDAAGLLDAAHRHARVVGLDHDD